MSKGSRPRPKSVDGKTFDNNFESIFGKHVPTYMKKLIPDTPVEDNTGVSKNEYQDILSTEDTILDASKDLEYKLGSKNK